MLLQAEIAGEVVKNSFNTSPETVYGVLVSVLMFGSLALAYGMWKLINNHKAEMKQIFERHEKADTEKYQDMKSLSEKMISGMTMMMGKIDELIRK